MPRQLDGQRHTGLAAIVATGAVAVVAGLAVPPAAAEADPASPLQPAVDQLLEAQQQIVDTNSQYPFVTPYDLTRLPSYTQTLAYTIFALALGEESRGGGADLTVRYAPFAWNAPAADPQPFITLANPDNLYSSLTVDPTQAYAVTVHTGPGTGDMTFVPNGGNGVTADYTTLMGALNLANAVPNPDGTYTIILSSTQPADTPASNWVDIAGADRVIVRDSLGDWGQIHDDLSMSQLGASTSTAALPQLSDDQLAAVLNTVTANMAIQNAAGTYFNTQRVFAELPANTFSPIKATVSNVPDMGELGSLLPGQLSSGGHFVLDPDQALVVKVPDVQAGYSGFQVADIWAQTLPYAATQGSLNNTQAFHDPDGFTYYVISSEDPGVANWVDNSGVADGEVYLRFINVTGPTPTDPITTQVVDVADVRDHLPTDTPVVTPAERAADLAERLFKYDYAMNQSHNISWVGANLQMDQVKAALGADEFHQMFGTQLDVPSVLDRLTPALTPDPVTVFSHLLADPTASATALMNNLPLAVKDIELPAILAVLRLAGAGDSGIQELGMFLDQTLTDPATSITAGFLNARDDLAVAVLNAGGATAPNDTLWNSLVELNHALVQSLSQLAASGTPPADDLSMLLDPIGTPLPDPADIAALTGSSLDLLP